MRGRSVGALADRLAIDFINWRIVMEKKIIATKVLAKKSKLSSYKKLSDLFDRVLKATSTDQTRYMFTMAYWDHDNKTFVATDGRRLHFLSGDMVNDFFSDVTASCFVERQGDMVVLYDKSYAAYPNWQRVVPDSANLERVQMLFEDSHEDHKIADFYADFSRKKTMQEGPLSTAIMAIGLCLDTSYLFDLAGGCYAIERTPKDNFGQREDRAIKLIDDVSDYYTFTAVIMPKQASCTIVD